ncbi:hypothetical protein PCANC_26208 [Puccinia coronata f. sp. avenae]|uniref:Uncharacterized protein n=1 Tax=Puccinia coronata f. sp. avenae TaxID=200324 RepID=A0A2N5TMJ9_9BASI|nr:hypothetical protein PCANC_27009 [Puccinia coronata f. sp. avenae]PLW26721.1 hypothetical protein PCANC_26208 [Puccinia coronata f. sp. avenae]
MDKRHRSSSTTTVSTLLRGSFLYICQNIKPAAERAVKRCRGDTSFLTQQKSVGKTSRQSARERPQGSQDSGNYGQTKTNETGHEPTSSLAPRITNPPLANRISPNNFRHQPHSSTED